MGKATRYKEVDKDRQNMGSVDDVNDVKSLAQCAKFKDQEDAWNQGTSYKEVDKKRKNEGVFW